MKTALATALLLSTLSAPAFAGGHATGDAAAGESDFRQCRSCHSIMDADGNDIVKGGRTGPNLWGLPGRVAGSDADFPRYGEDLVAAGESGLEWDEENFVAYVQDPGGFLKDHLDDSGARSMMSFRVRDEADAVNIWAYIASVSPEPEED